MHLKTNVIIDLGSPCRLQVVPGQESYDAVAESLGWESGLPPWPAFPDLLVNHRDRRIVGFVSWFGDMDQDVVDAIRQACNCWRVVVTKNVANWKEEYRGFNPTLHAMEIRLSRRPATGVEVCQMLNDWYYTKGLCGEPREVRGFGVTDLEDLCAVYRMKIDYDT